MYARELGHTLDLACKYGTWLVYTKVLDYCNMNYLYKTASAWLKVIRI